MKFYLLTHVSAFVVFFSYNSVGPSTRSLKKENVVSGSVSLKMSTLVLKLQIPS